MKIIKKLKPLRAFLLIILALSFIFTATSTYYFMRMKQDRAILTDIGPTLFALDVMGYKAKALFADDDGKYEIAARLYNNGLFSAVYREASYVMIYDLSDRGHPGGQTLHAGILLRHAPSKHSSDKALALYRQAAAQNYQPAIERLSLLKPAKQL